MDGHAGMSRRAAVSFLKDRCMDPLCDGYSPLPGFVPHRSTLYCASVRRASERHRDDQ